MAKAGVAGVTIEGAEELRKLLGSLPIKLEKKVLRQALRKSGKTVVAEAKRNAPVKSGLLKRKITLRALKMRRRYMVGVKVTGTQDAPHAHLNEEGTQDRYTQPQYVKVAHHRYKGRKFKKITGGKRFTGRMTAKPFMAPALESKTPEVLAILSKEIKAGVERERAKIGS